jgi:hypothetical protein
MLEAILWMALNSPEKKKGDFVWERFKSSLQRQLVLPVYLSVFVLKWNIIVYSLVLLCH